MRRSAKLAILAVSLACVGFAQMIVVNSASYAAHSSVAPGSIATVFGENLCGQTMRGAIDESGNLPTNLGGCSLKAGGMTAMLYYVSPAQINFIVPPLMPGQTDVVVNNGMFLQTTSVTVVKAAPGVFSMNGMGVGEGAILHGLMWRRGPFSVTTGGSATPVSIFLTGIDLSSPPQVLVGGVAAQVLYFGPAPGWPGLQQINIVLPELSAGAGSVPVVVISGGVSSNVTTIHVLPTDAMMQGMPGWGQGMHVVENMGRGHEIAALAFNGANNTVLVSDEDDDAVRVISLDSQTTLATISLPDNSRPMALAVSDSGALAAVALSGQNSVALLDLAQNKVSSIIGTGYFPMDLAFAGGLLLVANHAEDSVSVIDVAAGSVVRTVTVGQRPRGIAADPSNNRALVVNMLSDDVSVIHLSDFSVTTVPLPAFSRPLGVAVSPSVNKAVIASMMSGGLLLLNLSDLSITSVNLGLPAAFGPAGVVIAGSTAYVANQLAARVTEIDLASGSVLRAFQVPPGPRSLAVDQPRNRLIVLSQGTGSLDVIDLGTGSLAFRISGVIGDRDARWQMPVITAVSPSSAKAGSTFTLTIEGYNLSGVDEIEFVIPGTMGGGMMGGGAGSGYGRSDESIKATNIQVGAEGTRITATVEIAPSASSGSRAIRLETDRGQFMGMMSGPALFTVLAP